MLTLAIKAAKKAGELIKKSYRDEGLFSYDHKDAYNVVSKVDIEAEKIILDILRAQYPNHSFFSEEKGMIKGQTDYLWVIDPLDGSTNFIHGFPHFCVSIALTSRKEVIQGVVYHPMRKELFTAKKGEGGYLNQQKIHRGSLREIEKAVVIVNRGATRKEVLRYGKIINLLCKHIRTLRVPGASAVDLCYTACGKFDAFVGNGIKFYDCAAANLIATECGVRVTDFKGRAWTLKDGDLLVTGKALHPKFVNILKNV